MKILLVLILSFIASLVQCQIPKSPLQSVVDNVEDFLSIFDLIYESFFQPQDDISVLPVSKDTYHVNGTSEIYKKGVFVAGMTRSSNCRASLDKWDCPTCNSTLPDGVVVRAIRNHPTDATGYIAISAKNKAIYTVIRGSATRKEDDIVYGIPHVKEPYPADHPFIPGAKVHSGHLELFLDMRDIVYDTLADQIALHPNYTIEVMGHSAGGGVASLLAVDLFQRFPQKREARIGNRAYVKYIADNGISIKRYVYNIDAAPHQFPLSEGYEHEGDEYWIKSYETKDIQVCPGPYETRSCATSSKLRTIGEHVKYFGIYQGCTVEEKVLQTVPNFT